MRTWDRGAVEVRYCALLYYSSWVSFVQLGLTWDLGSVCIITIHIAMFEIRCLAFASLFVQVAAAALHAVWLATQRTSASQHQFGLRLLQYTQHAQ